MFQRLLLMVFFAASVGSPALFAHHGKEFIVNASFKTPGKGKLFALFSADHGNREHQSGGITFSPGLLYGLTERWSTEVHLHSTLAERTLHTEAVGIETRMQILGAEHHQQERDDHNHLENKPGFSLATSLEYSRRIDGSENSLEARFIAGTDLGPLSVVLNMITERNLNDGEGWRLLYAAGLKLNVTATVGAGLEFSSGMEHDREHAQLTPGIYTAFSDAIDFRLGISLALGRGISNNSGWRATLIYAL
jgi:hypothetical protein